MKSHGQWEPVIKITGRVCVVPGGWGIRVKGQGEDDAEDIESVVMGKGVDHGTTISLTVKRWRPTKRKVKS